MSVSCLCITYLRSEALEESIECFLKQTYSGQKELIIINDAEEQHLEFDHPEIVIFNSRRRFRTIGEKRNASVALAKYDYLAPWDDDDIFLPHRLEFSLNKITKHKLDYYNINEAFFYSNSQIKSTLISLFYSGTIFSRRLYTETSGHGFINSGQDLYLDQQLSSVCKKKYKKLIENTKSRSPCVRDQLIKKEDLYYIYRWGVSHHLSSTRGKKDQLNEIKEERKKYEKRSGKIILKPHWKSDYIKICNDFINQSKYSSLAST